MKIHKTDKERGIPKLTIQEKDDMYWIMDEDVAGSCYGKFKNRRHAEEILKDWLSYFGL